MANFRYVAKDKQGISVSGALQANSESDVADILHKEEMVVISIMPTEGKPIFNVSGKRVKPDDLVVFSRQLATLIDAGIPLVQALDILTEQIENANFKKVIMNLRSDIEAGVNFSDALSKHPAIFFELFINMTRAGEASGTLDETLDRLAGYLEKSSALARKIRSSLIYPEMVISMSIIITAFLLIKVVPTFKGIFATLGGELPLPTVILITVSDILRRYALIFLAGLIAAAFFLKRYISTDRGRYNFDAIKLRLPVLGQLFHKVALAKFSRTFATLVKSGIAVINALDIVSKTAGNKVIEQAVINCRNAVRDGETISSSLSRSRAFPAVVYRMIGVGEKTGQLEKMLSKIADFYDEQVDAAVAGLTSMIEPLVIAFLGVIIGGIVVSLFLPIFKITELIAR